MVGTFTVETRGLTSHGASEEEETAWWLYFENCVDYPREHAIETWTDTHWSEWAEERLTFHAGWTAAKGEPWFEFGPALYPLMLVPLRRRVGGRNESGSFVTDPDVPDIFERAAEADFPYKRRDGLPLDRDDVMQHLAHNAASNGVTDISDLDGWADYPRGAVRLRVSGVEVESWKVSD